MEETLQEQADEVREGSYERGQRSYELYYSLHAITPFLFPGMMPQAASLDVPSASPTSILPHDTRKKLDPMLSAQKIRPRQLVRKAHLSRI